ncbi:MAG: extracytoplasmic binding receptor [Hyphomicrobiales bacterium]|nr:extracytoplasmic binding receptor [Hyphomicrobiales bacterium]
MKALHLLFALALALPGGRAAAQDAGAYPTESVRLIVNSQAGGTTDSTTRLLAEELRKKWDRAVVVENVVGAGGNVGAAQVAQAAPNGLTLLVSHPGPLTVNTLLFASMPYDPAKLTPITILLSLPNVLVARHSLGLGSVKDLIAYAKQNPGKLSYGSQGVGTTTHLTAALLAARAGIDIVHVPYRGSPQAIMDLTSGVLDMMFDNLGSALPQHQAGTARILGVADTARAPALPDMPTLDEAGLPGFRSVTWFGLMGPAGLPGPLVDKINRDVASIMRSAAFQEKLRPYSARGVGSSPKEAADFIAQENDVWGAVIRDAGLAVK